jgi:phage tail-like protein
MAARFGGFSDVSGIGSEIKVAEYRNGNEKENHTRKVAGIHTAGDITGKRGIINSEALFDWIDAARINGPDAQKDGEDHAARRSPAAGRSRGCCAA